MKKSKSRKLTSSRSQASKIASIKSRRPKKKEPAADTQDLKGALINQELLEHLDRLKKQHKMSKNDSDAVYERMMERQDLGKEKKIRLKKDTVLRAIKECTYKPRINKMRQSTSMKNITERTAEILERRCKKRRYMKQKELLEIECELNENCTFTPKINQKNPYKKRHLSDLFEWKQEKENQLNRCRLEKSRKLEEGATFTPTISRGTKKILKENGMKKSGSTSQVSERLYKISQKGREQQKENCNNNTLQISYRVNSSSFYLRNEEQKEVENAKKMAKIGKKSPLLKTKNRRKSRPRKTLQEICVKTKEGIVVKNTSKAARLRKMRSKNLNSRKRLFCRKEAKSGRESRLRGDEGVEEEPVKLVLTDKEGMVAEVTERSLSGNRSARSHFRRVSPARSTISVARSTQRGGRRGMRSRSRSTKSTCNLKSQNGKNQKSEYASVKSYYENSRSGQKGHGKGLRGLERAPSISGTPKLKTQISAKNGEKESIEQPSEFNEAKKDSQSPSKYQKNHKKSKKDKKKFDRKKSKKGQKKSSLDNEPVPTGPNDRSVVVLNENNEFEEISSYLTKKRKLQIKREKLTRIRAMEAKRLQQELQLRRILEKNETLINSSKLLKGDPISEEKHNLKVLEKQFLKIDKENRINEESLLKNLETQNMSYNRVRNKILEQQSNKKGKSRPGGLFGDKSGQNKAKKSNKTIAQKLKVSLPEGADLSPLRRGKPGKGGKEAGMQGLGIPLKTPKRKIKCMKDISAKRVKAGGSIPQKNTLSLLNRSYMVGEGDSRFLDQSLSRGPGEEFGGVVGNRRLSRTPKNQNWR